MTGLCVPHLVTATPTKGLGVFATAPIMQGATVWRFIPGQYTVYDEAAFRAAIRGMSDADIVYELNHAFGFIDFPDHLTRIHDDGVLINHAHDANVATKGTLLKGASPTAPDAMTISDVAKALLDDQYSQGALRDIAEGDELTNNYGNEIADTSFYLALYEQFCVDDGYLDDE